MDARIEKINTAEQVQTLATLACRIWHEYFVDILSEAQIDYMVDRFQSEQAVSRQLTEGYLYYFLCLGDVRAGYFGVKPEGERLFLSKLYLAREFRGRGVSSRALQFSEEFCRQKGLKAIYLTVNRHNDHSVAVYRHWGFDVIEKKVADIGGGFVMDDFVMERKI